MRIRSIFQACVLRPGGPGPFTNKLECDWLRVEETEADEEGTVIFPSFLIRENPPHPRRPAFHGSQIKRMWRIRTDKKKMERGFTRIKRERMGLG
jgi:hypothetical protein